MESGDSDFADFQLKIAQSKQNNKFFSEMIDTILPTYQSYAKAYKAFYDALVEKGFTKTEALAIIKSKGIIPQ